MQAEGVHGEATGGVVNGGGPDAGKAASPRVLREGAARRLRIMAEQLEHGFDLPAGETKDLREIAARLDQSREESEAAERDAKARDEVDAECKLVAEELGRAAGQPLKVSTYDSVGRARVSIGDGDGNLSIPLDSLWWRLYLAAARELRQLREAVEQYRRITGVALPSQPAAKPKPSIVIGRYTLDRLSKGLCVDLVEEGSAIYPASDFPAEAVRRAPEPPSVDALAERVLGVIKAEALRAFAQAPSAAIQVSPASVARRIAEELCR